MTECGVLPGPSYPTPVRAVPELTTARAELWLKNDGLSHPVYGGNKVRKAQRLIDEALFRGARRVLSFGAAGSHHLLTLSLFARAAGLPCAALVIPQPRTDHALQTLRAAIGLGLDARALRYPALLPLATLRELRRGDYVVPPGGSNTVGAQACADAVDELALQIASGLVPEPDWIVVPLGSGGTCGGIAAGVLRRGLGCHVLGVQVVSGVGPQLASKWLARKVLRKTGFAPLSKQLNTRLSFDTAHVGPGYGRATEAGARATRIAAELGLELDQTYTAKAFASTLALLDRGDPDLPAAHGRRLRVLYWHTLAATPLEPLLEGAPRDDELSRQLRELFL
ncbi:MAG: pyridoxal-phosphate dependent enzyme [Polyangiaceae bacterium]